MMIMLKEIVGSELRDRTINPQHVVDVQSAAKDEVGNSVIELINGEKVYVRGSVQEITRRLNKDPSNTRLLKG